jgi:hypothetical protein
VLQTDEYHHVHTERTLARRNKGRPSWMGAPPHRSPMRLFPPSCSWQPQWPVRTMGPAKPQIGELFLST